MYPIIPFWLKTLDEHGWHELSLDELPRCTQFLSYQCMANPGENDLYGTFHFETIHLSRAVRDHLRSNAENGRITCRDQDFFDWLRGRDRECQATTLLPSVWPGIEIIVLRGVIETLSYEVWCHACKQVYLPAEVVLVAKQETIGTIYERHACPAGHVLSKIEVMHVNGSGHKAGLGHGATRANISEPG